MSESIYWKKRCEFKYYRMALVYGKTYAPNAKSILDVGGADCGYLQWFDWIPFKQTVDLRVKTNTPGINSLRIDFMEYQPARSFDVVLCLQVLEHLVDPQLFAKKLLTTAPVVIISVPYKWPKNLCKFHTQDPVDESKLEAWTGRPPTDGCIVMDKGIPRYVAAFAPL